jgi:hypothetical protein
LEQNQLVVLSASIGGCSLLTELILTENLLSELPSTIGHLTKLNNLNADRNRLNSIPNEICLCENIGLLSVRDNQISFLPDDLGNLQKLKVLDVAGNRLEYLPYSLINAHTNAIWLAENQATGKIKLQPDFDEVSQKQVLTCYLLPQQNFKPSTTPAATAAPILNDNSHAINENEPLTNNVPNSESVRFAAEPDNDDKLSHFVRTNTPHPKELAKKKEILKQRGAAAAAAAAATTTATTATVTTKTTTDNENINLPTVKIIQRPNDEDSSLLNGEGENDETTLLSSQQQPPPPTKRVAINTNKKVDFKLSKTTIINDDSKDENEELLITTETKVINDHQLPSIDHDGAISLTTTPTDDDETDNKTNNDNNNVKCISNGDEDTLSSGNFKLRRRDTPHHLKGARLNAPSAKAQQLNPNELNDIINKYTSTNGISIDNKNKINNNNSLRLNTLTNNNTSTFSDSLKVILKQN